MYSQKNIILRAITDIKHIFSRSLFVYYWKGANDSNFGDQLNIDLFKYYGFNPIHKAPGKAEIFAIGSILNKCSEEFNGIVLGSGFIQQSDVKPIKKAKIFALRGPKSNYYGDDNKNILLGDPGLLVKNIFGEHKKNHQFGLVPHFRDKEDPMVKILLKKNDDLKYIDIQQHPKHVVKKIAECEFIFTSSLHGLVVADAYGIPATWLNFNDRQTGGEFKFNDYHESINVIRRRINVSENTTINKLLNCAVKANYKEIERIVNGYNEILYGLRSKMIQ